MEKRRKREKRTALVIQLRWSSGEVIKVEEGPEESV